MLAILRFLTNFPVVVGTLVVLGIVAGTLLPPFLWYARTPLVIAIALVGTLSLGVLRAMLEARVLDDAMEGLIAYHQAEHEREQAEQTSGDRAD
jgi:hypothetical protein